MTFPTAAWSWASAAGTPRCARSAAAWRGRRAGGRPAARHSGPQPMKVADFEKALAMIHEFMNGREVNWNDKDLQLKWVREELPQIPMWVAGYGPKALGVAGRVGDGVIIQLADPEIIA